MAAMSMTGHADQLSPAKTRPNRSGSASAARIVTRGLVRPRFNAGAASSAIVGTGFGCVSLAQLTKREAKGVVQTTEGSCVVIGPVAARLLGVKQLQPQHRPTPGAWARAPVMPKRL
jgi:hypothetical protein